MTRFRSPFQLVFPGIQQLPLQLQFPRQRVNVFTGFHSFHNLPLELHGVPTPLCHSGPSCHCRLHSLSKCVFSACLNFGVQSIKKARDCRLPGLIEVLYSANADSGESTLMSAVEAV